MVLFVLPNRSVAFLIDAVPEVPPIVKVVAAPPRFKVVAVVFTRANDVLAVVILVVIVGLVLNTSTPPPPVSLEIIEASCADVVDANCAKVSVVRAIFITVPVKPFTVKTPVLLNVNVFPDKLRSIPLPLVIPTAPVNPRKDSTYAVAIGDENTINKT